MTVAPFDIKALDWEMSNAWALVLLALSTSLRSHSMIGGRVESTSGGPVIMQKNGGGNTLALIR